MKRVLLVIFTALLLFAGILMFLPNMIDWGKYKSDIVRQLGDATGYDVNIGGKLDLAIVPVPHVVIEDISIASAKGEKPFATAKRVDVSVALLPLFTICALLRSCILMSLRPISIHRHWRFAQCSPYQRLAYSSFGFIQRQLWMRQALQQSRFFNR